MTSKFQKEPFPVDKVANLLSITVKTSDGQTVDIRYKDLNLKVVGSQLCMIYESKDGELLMPIARQSTINRLYETE